MELMAVLTPPGLPKWTGLAKSDLEIFHTLFGTPRARNDVSMCPFCLQYTERSDACKYMKHTCPPGLRHERLYQLYAGDDEGRYWCTICGRNCMGHRHFQQSSAYAIQKARLVDIHVRRAQLFSQDCIPEGGGGVPEKVGRIQAMIDAAAEYQSSVGTLPAVQVRRMIIERAWNAAPSDATSLTFPATLDSSGSAPTFPDIPRPEADKDLIPINLGPDKECVIFLGAHEDHRPVFQFQHRKPDGAVVTHPPAEAICFEDMANELIGSVHEDKGNCPLRCGAKVHPDELKAIKDGTPAQEALYETYRTKYNEYNKVGGQRGGQHPFLVRMDNMQCVVPLKKGGRKTYRRRVNRKHARRATYRQQNVLRSPRVNQNGVQRRT